jgi:hypothetical protein
MHISARGDQDLLERLIAMAEMEGIPSAAGWVQQYIGAIISTPLTESNDTIASVFDYAKSQYEDAVAALPPKPGQNPAAVTDEYLRTAVQKLITPDQPPANG